MSHAIQHTTGAPGGLGKPSRRRKALRMGQGAGVGHGAIGIIHGDVEGADLCNGWPGAEF